MKAVILAGEEDAHPGPLTLNRPRSLVPLFDRPALEHLLRQLRRLGITQALILLRRMARPVMDRFGDGSGLGMALAYGPAGPRCAAGQVRDWAGGGDEDILVVRGDGLFGLDLSAVVGFHKTSRSAATLALSACPPPSGWIAAATGEDGRVTGFPRRPARGHGAVGACILTPHALALAPEAPGPDLLRDLLPLLLERGEPLYGFPAEGRWHSLDCGADLLSASADALAGRTALEPPAPRVAPGAWSASPIPPGTAVVPPVYIGPEVSIGPGALLGPNLCLGRGSRVGRRALVQNSILLGARAGDRATLYGAVLCPGARAGADSVLNDGVILGEGAAVGRGGVLMEGVRLWPGIRTSPGVRLTCSPMPPSSSISV